MKNKIKNKLIDRLFSANSRKKLIEYIEYNILTYFKKNKKAFNLFHRTELDDDDPDKYRSDEDDLKDLTAIKEHRKKILRELIESIKEDDNRKSFDNRW